MALEQSFTTTSDVIETGPQGQRGHRDHLAHTARLEQKLWNPRPGVWCMVGNGLSNQSFIEGPDGLICIDSGESTEEMAAALAAVREHTQAPIAAAIYTHFHYVSGTQALFDAGAPADLPIWGHEGIPGNLSRYGMDLSAAAGRGLVHQFGISLPAAGPDAVANVGLGLYYRNPAHTPNTVGFVTPNHLMSEAVVATIAGLEVHMTPAPSDADDNITIWFPSLGVCINNLIWPSLFNIFAIRGEEYRDPRILLSGLDHVHSLGSEHLLGAHGPPLSGAERIATEIVDYRDSIAFLWDQTVRGINRGLTMDELTEFVQLPDRFGRSYLTQQLYGLAEHHVRQIHVGLRGWFDGNEASLFPVPQAERYTRLIAGFGGRESVAAQSEQALDSGDLRWALELATWLVRSETNEVGRVDGGNVSERGQLAGVLRAIAQRTSSANVRNWCLTRAGELEDSIDLTRHRVHRFSAGAVMSQPASSSVHALRVLLEPKSAAGRHEEIRLEFDDGQQSGLRLRDGVAVPTSGADANLVVQLDMATWSQILANRQNLSAALEAGSIITSDPGAVAGFFAAFDHPALRA